MRSFANPENFFLYFRKPLVSALHSEVAARDHHADRIMSHRGHDQIWQAFDCLAGFNFQHDAQVVAIQLMQVALKLANVSFSAHERHSDQVRMPNDESQILQVPGTER